MLKALVKKQLLELFQSYIIDKKTGRARSKKSGVLFIVLVVLFILALGYAFYRMGLGLGAFLLGTGFNRLYFALMALMAMALGVFGSVFNTYGSLYLSKDNELMLSLPVPPGKLLLSRMLGVFLMSLLYSAWVWIPVTIAYWGAVPITVCRIIYPILLTFIIALFVTVLSCILGWIVAFFAARFKGKSFFAVLLSLTVIVVYYFFYHKVIGSLQEITAHINEIGNMLQSRLGYFWLIGAAADGDTASMLLVTGITVALAAVCCFILSKTFVRLALGAERAGSRAGNRVQYAKTAVRPALLRRELKHFTSLSSWMLNGGLGILLLPAAAVFFFIKRQGIRMFLSMMPDQAPVLYEAIPAILLALCCMMISIIGLTPVSVSIEGKNLWILQMLPVEAWDILRAKENMAVLLTLPAAVILAVSEAVVVQLPAAKATLLCISVCIYVLLVADFGLFLDLKHPNLEWTNPSFLTKQGLPVTINLFGGWAFAVVIGVSGFFLSKVLPIEAVLGSFIAVFFILFCFIRRWLKGTGSEILSAL